MLDILIFDPSLPITLPKRSQNLPTFSRWEYRYGQSFYDLTTTLTWYLTPPSPPSNGLPPNLKTVSSCLLILSKYCLHIFLSIPCWKNYDQGYVVCTHRRNTCWPQDPQLGRGWDKSSSIIIFDFQCFHPKWYLGWYGFCERPGHHYTGNHRPAIALGNDTM